MAAPAATTNAVRWGAEQRNHLTAAFESYKADATQGYSYRLQDLTADYLRHCWQHDVLFNQTNSRTFNSNYRNWATRFRTAQERQGIRRAAFERQPPPREWVCCCCCCHCHCYQIIMFDSYF